MNINTDLEKYKEFLEARRYNTLEEKNALLEAMDNGNPLKIAEMLGIKATNDLEAIAMIFQARKKSVSEIIEFQAKCNVCESQDFYFVDINDMFYKGKITIPKLINEIEDINEIMNVDDMPLDEFDKLEESIIENNRNIFDNNVEVTCKCGNKIKTSIQYTDIISKFSIKNIYEQYVDISTFSNMTKKDVDDMYPFEREIFIGLLQEKENKKSQV